MHGILLIIIIATYQDTKSLRAFRPLNFLLLNFVQILFIMLSCKYIPRNKIRNDTVEISFN